MVNTTEEKKRNIKKGQTVKFLHPSELTGSPLILTGVVLGFGAEVRKMWPEEMGEAPDDTLFVWRKDVFGNELHYAVSPDDVIKEEK